MGEPSFRFNVKCVLQGGFVVGVWILSSGNCEKNNQRLPCPKLNASGIIFGALLFWVTYFVNAVLDINLGCDHGSWYDKFKITDGS